MRRSLAYLLLCGSVTALQLSSRRQFISSTTAATAFSFSTPAFAAAVKTPEAAKAQIRDGYQALGTLLDKFDDVTSAEGGDGIRRVLGTVGTASPVYLIEPAFRLLFDADEKLPMEYIDGVEKLMLNLQSADSEAYSANFITFSSAKGTPEEYFKRSNQAIVRARKDWLELMKLLEMPTP